MFTRNLPTVFTTLFLNILFIFNAKAQIFESVGQFVSDTVSEARIIRNGPGGTIYTTGFYYGNTDLDPGPGTFMANNSGSSRVFITKTDTAGNLIWVKTFHDSVANHISDMQVDNNGNMYLSGYEWLGDPFHAPNFITKYDATGNLVWRRTFGTAYHGSTASRINDLYLHSDGSLFTCGYYSGDQDLIVGDTSQHPVYGHQGGFIQKFDNNGNFVWLRYTTGNLVPGGFPQGPGSSFLSISGSGNKLYLVGNKDMTGNLYYQSAPVLSTSDAGAFVLCTDTSGNPGWIGSLGLSVAAEQIEADNGQHVYISGHMHHRADFDPGSGEFIVDAPSTHGHFIEKLDSAGNFVWVRTLLGPPMQGGLAKNFMALDNQNNVYLTSAFDREIDLDPGTGIQTDTSGWGIDAFVVSLTPDGDFSWSASTKGTYDILSNHILVLPDNTVLVSGFFQEETDFDPGPGTQQLNSVFLNGFLWRLQQDPCTRMITVADSVIHLSCQASASVSLHTYGGTAPYMYTLDNDVPTADSTLLMNTSGIHNIQVSDNAGCSRTVSLLINGPLPLTDFDLETVLIPGIFRPGFVTNVPLQLHNNTCTPVNGSLKLVYDPLLIYNGSVPPPSAVSGDTLIWDFSNLSWGSAFTQPEVFFSTPANAMLGDSIFLTVMATPFSNDADSSNNIRNYMVFTVGAYDPNDKQVYPTGDCTPGYISQNQELTYTVRFQNTGSAAAYNVCIVDKLSPVLDLNSVRILAASHDMYTKIMPGNVLHFMFDNIMLPDSNSNEPLSHGYVVFRVNPLPGSTPGSEIRNKVGIYFDYNAPVITNEVLNTIADSSYIGNHTQTTVSTANSSYTWHGVTYNASGTYTRVFQNVQGCDSTVVMTLSLNASSLAGYGQNGIRLFPNPAQDQLQLESKEHVNDGILRIYSITGQLVRERKNVSGTQFSIDLTGLAPDVYTLELYDGQQHRRSRFVKQ